MPDEAAAAAPVSASGRPRRTTRPPARLAAASAPSTSTSTSTSARPRPRAPAARKPRPDPAEQLRVLLHEPRSALTTLEMTDLINARTWNALSPAARTHLATLLPPTAFKPYTPALHPSHPSQASASSSPPHPSTAPTHAPSAPAPAPSPSPSPSPKPDPEPKPDAATLDARAFTDAHTLSAMRTFQDQLYTGWLAPAHALRVARFHAAVRAGTLHVPWKDEVWEAEHGVLEEAPSSTAASAAAAAGPGTSSSGVRQSAARAGDAGEWKLQDLIKRGIVKAGDVLAYRRHFTHGNLTIEKDVLIDSIHPKSHTLTLLMRTGPTRALPRALLAGLSTDDAGLRTANASSPAQIENAVLDLDGRVPRGQRPNGNAWKTLTVWREREDADADGEGEGAEGERGGRTNRNTLFYLRGCYYGGG